MKALLALLAVLAPGGCGLGAGEGGGSDFLPTAGLGPYGKVDDLPTPPFIIVDNAADLRDPSALPRANGGYRVWFTRQDDADVAIYAADVPGAHVPAAGPPVRILDGASSPGAVRFGSEILLFHEAGADIALAVSTDDGASFEVIGPVFPGASPGPAVLGGELFVYFEGPGGIHAARSLDGRAFEVYPEPVLTNRSTEALAFDREWVGDPAAVGGDDRVALFYVGRAFDGDLAIGAAASRDGITFERAGGGEAVLEPGMRDETGPSAVLFPSQGILFFAQAFGQVSAIGVATSP